MFYSAFQSSSFWSRSYQIARSGLQVVEEESGGGTIASTWGRSGRKKAREVSDLIDEIISEFSEKPNNEIYEKAAYKEVVSLAQSAPFFKPIIQENIPVDRDYLTFEQMLIIRQRMALEYRRLMLILDDDEVILALYAN